MRSNTIVAILGLMFIGLKLTGHIAWSWWFVLLPFYGGFVLMFVGWLLGKLSGAR